MINKVIDWSIENRFFVILITVAWIGFGIYSISNTSVDAIPDLSDVQVIIKTNYPGQAPQVVEDHVTYPISTAMLSVPGATNVRGFSFFGDSFVYVIFNDDTDIYWARSRVLEYLNQVASTLPENAKPQLGPDATGVGWVYIYTLIDTLGKHDVSELRSLQDWFLKYELQAVSGVSEVATAGGMVKQYQVEIDPHKLQAFGLPLAQIRMAITRGNQETGASVVEMAEAEYMLRATGYIKSIEDLESIPLGINQRGVPLLLKDVADIRLGPKMRRGVTDYNGLGESVGGIVVMRFGENAQQTIEAVKEKLATLQNGLPKGVEIVSVYDRSKLITSAIDNLLEKLLEEIVVVSIICLLFLFHFRSAVVVMLVLPIGVMSAIVIMHMQGMNANIMSLGGIAIAIGAMVDGAIVMIENLHKKIEIAGQDDGARWPRVKEAAQQVGPALFFSLLIITVSFAPVFALEAQEGRLFSPLAYTKTYAMGAAAILTITLVPVLMGYLVKGKIQAEENNQLNRLVKRAYIPTLVLVLNNPRKTLIATLLLLLLGLWPLGQLGSEFMPPLDEGDLMYMPTTYPGLSIGEARKILQLTDRMIMTVPEVASVFGKIGRAETATDPAPLTMIETFVQLKPRSEWREGMDSKKLRREFDNLISIPGLKTNAWVMPIKTRIDMLATGIKTPVGVKIAGPDLATIQKIGEDLERIIEEVPGTASVYSERVSGGRYLTIDINRVEAARFGLNIRDVQDVLAMAVGGVTIGLSVEGLERYPINIRYPQEYRDSVESLRALPIVTPSGLVLALADVAAIRIEDGPPGIKSENARINGWTFIDIKDVDVGTYVENAIQMVDDRLQIPPGYSIKWSGQYEYMVRAKERLSLLGPLTVLIIALLLYANFRRPQEVLILLGTLPLSLIGGVWLLYLYDYNISVAVGVGFIALAGVSIEIGMIVLVYLNDSYQASMQAAKGLDRKRLIGVIVEGAGRRIRPVIMTVAATIVGLLPILFGSGTGSEVMTRMAAPMVGGMLSAFVLTMLVLPVIFLEWKAFGINDGE
ncbi:MAG: CusA/CzcA family heavy metal efflux RND transporter [bacterium]|nr:efflux RND transporter permease subunit [Gammaproteobacteria bacterium]HIL98316.1 efflux RND transporter permease subunit [Pseudomonadales bacterium]